MWSTSILFFTFKPQYSEEESIHETKEDVEENYYLSPVDKVQKGHELWFSNAFVIHWTVKNC